MRQIYIFPWNKPFLPAFRNFLDSRQHGSLEIPLLISPTYRPWQYLQKLYGAGSRARILPRLVTLTELVELWHKDVTRTVPAPASLLDSVHLLWQAIQHLSDDEGKTVLGGMDLNSFFPWGEKLAVLLDEMLTWNILPEDVLACEDEVLPVAARLLQSLGQTGENYLALLRQHNLTTSGLALYDVASSLDQDQPLPAFVQPTASRPVYIMGFYALSASRERILRRLWEEGATVCLHSDPLVADPQRRRQAHWICQRHVQWVEDWQAETILYEDSAAAASPAEHEAHPAQRVHFFSGYDVHSQLEQLQQDLDSLSPETRACVLLPSASLLMPTLHHVPEHLRPHLNIAMGVCISDTPIFQLLHDLLVLQDNRNEAGHYHWKQLLACVDSPLLAGLQGPEGESILPAVRRYRTQLCHGLRFLNPFEDVLMAEAFDNVPGEAAAMQELLHILITGFADLSTTEDLAEALQRVCDHITLRGSLLRATSPVDMEALFHIEHGLLPMLRQTLLHTSPLGLSVLQRIFDDFCHREHMFFEPGSAPVPDSPQQRHNPCEAALQIVNVLESTLLSFDRVYLLEATDDNLPGPRKHDPLLPDSLRALLGLPDLRQEETETGYGILRLCKSSAELFFYWQEGITRTWLFDGKKSRSRFVEEYIWEREQAEGRVLESGEDPLLVARCRLTPMQPKPRFLAVQDEMLQLMQDRLSGMLSPSVMDKYLACPLAFGFECLAALKPLDMVNEGDDPSGLGTLIHKVLEIFHGRHLNELLDDRDAASRELIDVFTETIHAPECVLRKTLPPASLAMLEAQAVRKLDKYIRNQPRDSRPILLEAELRATISVCGSDISLLGRIDRMDRRDYGLVVLDYKTGHINNVAPGLWEMSEFFEKTQDLVSFSTLDARDYTVLDELFQALRSNASSVQLPCYVTICRSENRHLRLADNAPDAWPAAPFSNAAFVALADKGQEIPIDTKKPRSKDTDEERARRHNLVLDRCPSLVELVIMHMQKTQNLAQMRDPRRCSWCSYARLCQS